MKTRTYILTLLCMMAACTQKEGFVSPDELGVKETEPQLQCTTGTYQVEVLCDGDYTASLSEDNWISFKGISQREISGNGDSCLEVEYGYNRGLERTASMVIVHGRKTLTVNFHQYGILSSSISMEQHSIVMPSDASGGAVKILSVYKDSDLNFEVIYADEGGWIRDVTKVNNFITFNVLDNSTSKTRMAELRVSSKTDPAITDAVQISQLGQGTVLTGISFKELKDMAVPCDTVRIEGAYVLEGIVSGDDSECNGGENMNISASLQDKSLSARTMFLQNEDASSGFKIVFCSEDENILRRYDKVRILLDGVCLKSCGGSASNDPLRYEILDVKATNILYTMAGSSYDLPVKEKYIEELTDADVYTYVTLKDCEIPVRKGPFVPIDLRHRQVIHSYPMVIRDIKGGNSHIMTNLGASWERDGKGLPQGSGNISGVIVHENCDNFEWNNTEAMRMLQDGILIDYVTGIGNIGKYQIRPFTKKEIALEEDFENGFSDMIMEIRYFNSSNKEIVKNVASKYIYSTYPAVPEPTADPSVKGRLCVINKDKSLGNIALWRDWTHVGPYVNGVITEPENGNGVDDYYNIPTEFTPYSAVSTTALIMKSSAWYSSSGWSTEKYWCASFSTEGLSETNFPLSVQIGAISGLGQTVGAPRYWILEYSADGTSWSSADEYTVPDFPILSNRKPWQCPGPKYVSINLPEDSTLLGRNEVFVRMRPVSSQAGTPASYDGGSITENRETVLNYFAIRYNK